MKTKMTDTLPIPWELILLSMLSKEDLYGSQMAKQISSLSNGRMTPLMGSMYPILYRLTDEKCVEFYEKSVGRRSSVVYYHITEKGREKAKALIEDFRDQVSVVEMFMNM